ncbi:MAG TPA: YdeI/OmpD-associated family protein [Chitinophagaceae bacterium]|jgi:uncharacterized protein YdeI (YjbR/CyaY-like superfamily)
MHSIKPIPFTATIEIIGVNPFVFLPGKILQRIFKQAGKEKGKIPVKIKIEGHEFIQTLIKYSGEWRLYLNTPMRKAAKKEVGDKAKFEIMYDPSPRIIPMHLKLKNALMKNKKANKVFESLAPSRQSEITRYISFLKNEETVDKNVARAINFLLGKERFIARDKP